MFRKKCALFVFVFLCWRKGGRKYEKRGGRRFRRGAGRVVFLGGCGRGGCFFAGWHFLKNRPARAICVRKVKKSAYSLQLSVFGKWSFILCPFKVTKHYNNRGLNRHRGKPKMALLVAKVPFWEGASKGALLSVVPKGFVLLKALFL